MIYIHIYIHKTYYYKKTALKCLKKKLSSLSIDLQKIHTQTEEQLIAF